MTLTLQFVECRLTLYSQAGPHNLISLGYMGEFQFAQTIILRRLKTALRLTPKETDQCQIKEIVRLCDITLIIRT